MSQWPRITMRLQRKYLSALMKEQGWNVSAVARVLDLDRGNLHKILRRLEIKAPDARSRFVSPGAPKIPMPHNLREVLLECRGDVAKTAKRFKLSYMTVRRMLDEQGIPYITRRPGHAPVDLGKESILKALNQNFWNVRAAALTLGCSHVTLYKLINKHRIVIPPSIKRKRRRGGKW